MRADVKNDVGRNRAMGVCPCCDSGLRRGRIDWQSRCRVCGYEASSLQPQINRNDLTALDENQRREGLQALRVANFHRLLELMAEQREPHQQMLLDVGAAHGWFVQACTDSSGPLHWTALGLEPDETVASQARAEGRAVRSGFFPQALEAGARFDAIAFNDVFEHLPDPASILAACRQHLQPGGLLVLNLPSTEGIFFRTASVLAHLGWSSPLRRLWQEGMPSPHLHYFNADNLSSLLHRHGFEVRRVARLDSIRREGLMARLRYDPRSAWMAPLLGPLLWLLIPLLQRLKPDIRVLIAVASASAH